MPLISNENRFKKCLDTVTSSSLVTTFWVIHYIGVHPHIFFHNIAFMGIKRCRISGGISFCLRAFCLCSILLQIFCRQNDTLFPNFVSSGLQAFCLQKYCRLDATKLCVKLPISVGQMRQNVFSTCLILPTKEAEKISYLGLG
jgi:hypothetical protein